MSKHLKKEDNYTLQTEVELETPQKQQKTQLPVEHQEAGCLFTIFSFIFFLIWLYITILLPINMTFFSLALLLSALFYLKNPAFFSDKPDPKHKSMSFIFAIYFLLSTIFGLALYLFNIKISLPF